MDKIALNRIQFQFVCFSLLLVLSLFVLLAMGYFSSYFVLLPILGSTALIAWFMSRLITKPMSEELWEREGQLLVVSAARGGQSVRETAYNVLKSLCTVIEGSLGVVYLVNADRSLSLLEGYAIDGDHCANKRIEAREGVLGSALETGQICVDRYLPEDYFRIESGLGSTRPRHRLVAPIFIEGNPIAVIEIAGLKEFSEKKVGLVKRVLEGIGLALIASKSREEAFERVEEIRVQSEEMRVSNQALELKTKELEESECELSAQAKALKKVNIDLEEQTAEIQEQNKRLAEQNQQIEKQAEEIAEKMCRIEQSSKYKSEFLANMSHELRSPLNSLLILAKGLYENEEGNLSDEQVEEAGMIYKGGIELLSLLNDLLDFSKIEAGKVSIARSYEPLQGIIEKLEKQFSPLIKEKNLTLKTSVDDKCPETFYTDSQRLEQILRNLLSNAVKFTKKGDVTLAVNLKGEELAFSVADTGIGIDEGKRKEVFEAFQQEDGSIGRKYGGTGLGLSISNKLANLLGGRIVLESEKNKGSIFTLFLPVQQDNLERKPDFSKRPEEILARFPSNKIQEKTLLIIEDDHNFAKTLGNIAVKKGYRVLVAGCGKDGLMQAHENRPAAIILDLALPDIDGLIVLEQLKASQTTGHIPVHVISARSSTESAAVKKGAISYLTKPVKPEQLDSMFAGVANISQESVKRVLLIEDDRVSQSLIKKILERKELEVTAVGLGNEGLKMVNNDSFDCIILDIQLPDMSGFEWLKKAEKLDGVILPPVVVYTGRTLTIEETYELEQHTHSIIIKGAHSQERLVDEVSLFLHAVHQREGKESGFNQHFFDGLNEVLNSKKVLVVDDDIRNVFALSKVLKKKGVSVIVADNGKVAIEQLNEHPDIVAVVMDIMMPVMDGYEAIKQIREIQMFKELPIIALTARTMPDEREKCFNVGANDYLSKPLDVEMLIALLRIHLFERKEVVSGSIDEV